jgi:HK97 family phage major capsid protein
MAVMKTPESVKGLAMDKLGLAPQQAIPDSVLIRCTTKAAQIEGDEPVVRVPFINLDASVGFVKEADLIPESNPEQKELTLLTGKIAVFFTASHEQLKQDAAQELISHEIRRSMLAKVDWALLQQPAPTAPDVWPPAGLLAHAIDGGDVGTNLDTISDAIANLQISGGDCTHILAAPDSWAWLSQLKETKTSNKSLVGAVTVEAQKSILSTPVVVTNAMPSGKVLLLDKSRTLSAHSGIQVAQSEDALFQSDSVALRATFRMGAGFVPGAQGIVLNVAPPVTG